jgi:hypothetical protein
MEQIKMDFYQLVRNLILSLINGNLCHLCNIRDQVLLLLFMESISIFLEDTQVRIRELELYNHTQMEIQGGEDFLIICQKACKDL